MENIFPSINGSPDDQVKRTDFNADNAKIDTALNDLSDGLAAAQAEKADQSALDALAAEVAKKGHHSGAGGGPGGGTQDRSGDLQRDGNVRRKQTLYAGSYPDAGAGASAGPGAPADRLRWPDQMPDTDSWSGGGRLQHP